MFFLMIAHPPRSTLTDSLFPYPPLFRSAKAPVAQPPEGFLFAAKNYRRIIELYPQDAKLPDINFLLGDALLDGGHTLEAAQEYSKTAYGYRAHIKAPEAAYAAVLAYQKYAKEVPADQRPQALKQTGRASCRERVCQYV